MSFRNVAIIFKKELTDIVRDRRTLGFMVVLPIVVIPGLMWVMSKFVESGVKRLREEPSIVAVIGEERSPSMVRLLGALDRAADDPGALAQIGDPVLSGGLMNVMSPEQTADAMLIATALDDEDGAQERLGSARFLEVTSFAPTTEAGRALFANGAPSFLADPGRLRLLRSAHVLRDADADTVEALTGSDPSLLADQQRLAAMSDSDRATLDAELAAYETLRAEIGAGIEARTFHTVLIFHDGFQNALENDGSARYSVLFDESQEKSEVAKSKLTGFLDRLDKGLVRVRVSGHGLERTLLDPLDGQRVNIGRERSILAVILPYIVMLMCFAGAIYPAIDLGAGEKERGTLETLLVTPASRFELVLGKFLVITLAALTASFLNIASLTASFKLGLIGDLGTGALSFDPTAAIVSMVLMLPVAAFFAGVLLAVSIFAKSFKEAQSYSAPINMAVILPAVVSFVPGIELTIPLSFVPLVNVALALKEAWAGIFQWDCIAIILISSVIYAALTLLFCAKWFQREQVLFRT